jgi:hypothetical protein
LGQHICAAASHRCPIIVVAVIRTGADIVVITIIIGCDSRK